MIVPHSALQEIEELQEQDLNLTACRIAKESFGYDLVDRLTSDSRVRLAILQYSKISSIRRDLGKPVHYSDRGQVCVSAIWQNRCNIADETPVFLLSKGKRISMLPYSSFLNLHGGAGSAIGPLECDCRTGRSETERQMLRMCEVWEI